MSALSKKARYLRQTVYLIVFLSEAKESLDTISLRIKQAVDKHEVYLRPFLQKYDQNPTALAGGRWASFFAQPISAEAASQHSHPVFSVDAFIPTCLGSYILRTAPFQVVLSLRSE